MRIESVTLEGFRSWRDRQTVDLSGRGGLIGIAGDNRAGKTSLLAAIEFACWGTNRGLVSAIISRGATAATVELVFANTHGRYRITRRRSRDGRHEVKLELHDGRAWSKVGASVQSSTVDARIHEVVGMDERTSAMTWLVRQNDYGAFCALAPAKRREQLISAFGLDRFARWANAADDMVASLKADVNRLRGQAENEQRHVALLEADVDGLDLNALAAQLRQADETVASLRDACAAPDAAARTAQNRLTDLRATHERYLAMFEAEQRRLTNHIGSLTSRLELGQRTLQRADAAAAELGESRAELARCGTALAAIEARLEQLTSERAERVLRRDADQDELAHRREHLAQLERQSDGLTSSQGTCVVCQTPLTPERAHMLLQSTAHAAADVSALLAAAQQTLAADEEELAQLDARMAEGRRRHSTRQAQLQQLSERIARTQAELDAADGERAQQAALEAERAELGAQLESLTPPTWDAALEAELIGQLRRTPQMEALQAELGAAQADRDRIAVDLASAQQAADRLDTSLRSAGELADELAGLEARLDDVVCIRSAFAPAGIPAKILAGVLDELNTEANKMLAATADDGLTVNVSASRWLAGAKNAKDEITIYVASPSGDLSTYETLSGSEQFRVALAIRVALARCIASRTGTPVSTLVIDEGWGSLDTDARRQLASVLFRLSSEVDILTVTHIDDVKSTFPTLVTVDASTGTSTASVSQQRA